MKYEAAEQIKNDALRVALGEALAKLTYPQSKLFYRIYKNGLVIDAKLPEAYELVRRTLEKNSEKEA